MNDKEKKNQNIDVNINPRLNTPWIDVFNLSKRNDDLCLLRFFTDLPEGKFEQSRVMTSKSHLMKFVDVICSSLDYYPVKSEKKLKQ